MTTATATWPIEADFKSAEKALAAGYNQAEEVLWHLRPVVKAWMDEGKFPEERPTLELVGAVYSFLETLRTEAEELRRMGDDLNGLLGQLDSMRLDAKVADAS